MATTDAVLVLTTLPTTADAITFSRALVDARLAGCVSVLPPMDSIYRWNDGIEHDTERQVVIKSRAPLVDAIYARVRELHPYEVPEWLVLPVAGGGAAYLEWLTGATT